MPRVGPDGEILPDEPGQAHPDDVHQQQLQNNPDAAVPMQNFKDFLKQEKEQRQKADKEMLDAKLESEARQKADAQVKRVPPCDGATPHAIREWIREIQLTIPYSSWTVYIAAQAATGSLRRDIEFFLSIQPDRQAVTWTQVQQHVEQSFLTPHEEERLKDEVENCKQGAYENSAAYGRRFREAVDLGYPLRDGAGNPDRTRTLLRSYLKGLSDRHLASRILKKNPADYPTAMDLVQKFEAQDFKSNLWFNRELVERNEEPMEIGAMAANPQQSTRPKSSTEPSSSAPQRPPAAQPSRPKPDSDRDRRIDGLTKQVTQIMSMLLEDREQRQSNRPAPQAASRPPRPAPRAPDAYNNVFLEDGTPVCSFCQRSGHIARDCRKKKRQQGRRRPQENQ